MPALPFRVRIAASWPSTARPRAPRHHEAVPRRARERPRRLRAARGRGARAARRERRRQVDADEHPLRALPPGRGRDPAEREEGLVLVAEGRDRGGHRHGAPALHADPGDDGRREHRPRRGAHVRRRDARLPRGEEEGARAVRALRPRRRPRRAHPGHHRRAAAARGDPEGALPRRGDPRPRRADRRADAAGGEGALRDPRRAARAGEVDHLHQPQAARGARDRRPDHRPAARQEGRDHPERGRDRGEPRPGDGRPRSAAPRGEAALDAGRVAAPCRRPARLRRPGPREGDAASPSTCAPARSSASPASTATARPS